MTGHGSSIVVVFDGAMTSTTSKDYIMKLRNIFFAAAGLAMTIGAASAASAYSPRIDHRYAATHPRPSEGYHRTRDLYGRINSDPNGLQRHRLDTDVHRIRLQQRRDMRWNHGRLTANEYRQINREQNNVERQAR
jgi:hypothetical protein